MKTTVEISEDLLVRAKKLAAEEGTTMRDLIESGLRNELLSRQKVGYVMVDASFGGEGLQPGIVEGDWSLIRELIYDGRGG